MHSHSALGVYTGRYRRSDLLGVGRSSLLPGQTNWKVSVEIIKWLIQSVLMLGFVAIAMAVLAGLFMIVFSIAAGIDRRINQ